METRRPRPLHHADPFDRLLTAQARIEGATVVTQDRQVASYDVRSLRTQRTPLRVMSGIG